MAAFLTITAVISISVLGANIGIFGDAVRTSDFAKWGVTAVLATIVGATVLAYKWWLSPLDISVNLDFSPTEPIDIDLDMDQCTYEIREEGKK